VKHRFIHGSSGYEFYLNEKGAVLSSRHDLEDMMIQVDSEGEFEFAMLFSEFFGWLVIDFDRLPKSSRDLILSRCAEFAAEVID
jgi:hypothetical protein